MTRIMRTNHIVILGSAIKIMNALGIAPMNGPKKGIMLVIPTITLIRGVNGIPIIDITINVSSPMIIESIILPTTNPPKVLSVKRTRFIRFT